MLRLSRAERGQDATQRTRRRALRCGFVAVCAPRTQRNASRARPERTAATGPSLQCPPLKFARSDLKRATAAARAARAASPAGRARGPARAAAPAARARSAARRAARSARPAARAGSRPRRASGRPAARAAAASCSPLPAARRSGAARLELGDRAVERRGRPEAPPPHPQHDPRHQRGQRDPGQREPVPGDAAAARGRGPRRPAGLAVRAAEQVRPHAARARRRAARVAARAAALGVVGLVGALERRDLRARRRRRRGRVERDPAEVVEPRLDPRVRVGVAHDPRVLALGVAARREARHDARRDAAHPQQQRHRAGEVLAVAALRLEQEPVERRAARRHRVRLLVVA